MVQKILIVLYNLSLLNSTTNVQLYTKIVYMSTREELYLYILIILILFSLHFLIPLILYIP